MARAKNRVDFFYNENVYNIEKNEDFTIFSTSKVIKAKKVVLAGACRTAIGTMGGSLSTTPAPELGAIVINLSDKPVTISRGDRIVQAMLHKLDDYEIQIVDSVEDGIDRGGGFGSTGIA